MSNVEEKISAKIENAVATAIRKDSTDAAMSAVVPITEEVAKRLTPLVLNATNNEPWYQSRVTWGAIASIVLPLLGAFGVSTDIIDANQLTAIGLALGGVVGGFVTLYGRWRAKKPIGT